MLLEILERGIYIALGGVLGFILRGITDSLKAIKEELDDVDNVIKHRDESGFIREQTVFRIALALAVGLCVYAAIATAISNDKIEEQQDELTRIAYCNQQYLAAQAEFLEFYLDVPPPTDEEKREEIQNYLNILEAFIEATEVDPDSDAVYHLPKNLTLEACLKTIAKENNNG